MTMPTYRVRRRRARERVVDEIPEEKRVEWAESARRIRDRLAEFDRAGLLSSPGDLPPIVRRGRP